MKLQVKCPACSAVCRLAAEHAGRQVRCGACQNVFVAQIDEEIPFAELKPEPPTEDRLSRDDPSQRRRVPPPPPMPEQSRPRQHDDPLRDADEEPEARRPRRERDEPPKSSSTVLLLVIGGVLAGVLVLCGVGGTVGYLLWPRPTASFSGTVNNLPPMAGAPGGKDKEVIGRFGNPILLPDLAALKDDRFGAPGRGDNITYLRVKSSAGDFIGQGREYFYDAGQLQASAGRPLSFRAGDWDLEFSGPRNEGISVGTYRDAKRWPFNDDSPGLNFSGNGRGSNTLSGHFVVWELELDGQSVRKAAIDFVQRSGEQGPPLFGRLRYHATFR